MASIPKKLLLANKAWAKERIYLNPNYFKKHAKGQSPKILWIGCSDSRVPESQITGTEPGEIFVHRNIANVVHVRDFNIRSVLLYAIESLHIEHIILCGHKQCGGIAGVLSGNPLGELDPWLAPVTELRKHLKSDLEGKSSNEQLDLLVEQNVRFQVNMLSRIDIVQRAWANGKKLCIHGWVYELEHGLLKSLYELDRPPMAKFDKTTLPPLESTQVAEALYLSHEMQN